MHDPHVRLPNSTSVPGLIAWLSVCMLAAAWGRTLDERWQLMWAQTGAIGLIAAFGLGGFETAHERRAAGINSNRMSFDPSANAASAALYESVRQLADDARAWSGLRRADVAGQQSAMRGIEAGLLSGCPLSILGVEEKGSAGDGRVRPIAGAVRKIASRVILFDHVEPISTRTAVLAFDLESGEQLSFVVELQWTERTTQGFVSGAEVLAVGDADTV